MKDKLIRYLYSIQGKDQRTANHNDIYIALCFILREIIGMNWESSKTRYNNLKTVYILSFEYLPGKMLEKNLMYLGLRKLTAEVLAEMGFDLHQILEEESELGIGHGGLGVTSDSYLDSLSTLEFPGFAYGMRYERGLMVQKFVNGAQVEQPDNWLQKLNVWEIRKYYNHTIQYRDFKVRAQSYDIPYLGYKNNSVNTLRLWGAEPVEDLNFESFSKGDLMDAYDDYIRAKSISEFLYPDDSTRNGKKFRLQQEYFYISASIQDIIRRYFKYKEDISKMGERICIDLNDTHPILAIPELFYRLKVDYGMSYNESREIAMKLFTYTNHTVLSESFELWDMALIDETIPQLCESIRQLDAEANKYFAEKKVPDPDRYGMQIIQGSHLNSVNLACYVARHISGLSQSHLEILQNDVLRGYYQLFPHKFEARTCGVSHRKWLLKDNGKLENLITEAIGDKYRYNSHRMIDLLDYSEDESFLDRLGDVKMQNKIEIAACVKREMNLVINPHSIYDFQFKRFHEFKRQLLNTLHICYEYFRLKENANYDLPARTYFFGGKAPSSYYFAKEIISFINAVKDMVNKDRLIKDKLRIVFIENYNMEKAEYLIKAAEINESLATASKEATSLSTVKFMMNGAITIGTRDGINKEVFEMLGNDNCFPFGLSVKEVQEMNKSNAYNAYDYYNGSPQIRDLINRLLSLPWQIFPYDFKTIYNMLIKYNDSFFVMRDFLSYINAQEELEKRYSDKSAWNRMSLVNIANSGQFTMDHTILDFSDRVWRINNEHF